jgi:hypothetical protein
MAYQYSPELRLEIACEYGIIVNDEDRWLLEAHTWSISNSGYVVATYNRKTIALHHCIIGFPILGLVTDHKDRNKLNNARHNIHHVTRKQNHLNSAWADGAYHIYPVTNSNTYQVIIVRDNTRHHVGTYDTIEEAERERDTWLSKHGT